MIANPTTCYLTVMDRRNFLKAGAVAGGGMGLSAVGCGAVMEGLAAVPVPSIDELSALNMDGFLKSLDTSLGYLRSSSSLDALVSKDVQDLARKDPRFSKSEEVVRSTMRQLLLTGSFGDLPEVGRLHPGMQARMWSSVQEMDDAVGGMNKMLTSLTPTERADISRLLREDPTVTERVLQTLDEEGAKAGVNEKRRNHMREVGKHACFRLRQSTGLFIDEYDDKVKKVTARDGSVEAFQRRFMAQMGETAFWDYHRRQMALAQAWQQVPGIAQQGVPQGVPPTGTMAPLPPPPPPGDPGYAPPMTTGTTTVYPYLQPTAPAGYAPVQPGVYGDPEVDENGRNLKKLRTGTILLGVGGGLLGLGLIAGVTSAFLVSNPDTAIGGYFVITAAALLGLGGIACLIAGGVIRSRA
ncbi:MAG: twin-arginine translocation signal domain-containing protein [Polyangiaceae bacterium]|nr:twin-arginine translocation signal domain-containing protein [Polyangiaceae bacterium]